MMRPLKAICFDLDNTFWDVVPVIQRAERELHAWLSTHYPAVVGGDDIEAMRRDREAVAQEHPHRRHDVTFLRLEALRRRAVAAGHPVEVAAAAFDVFYAERNRVELFADVHPALRRLAPHYRLLTLTNGNADLARIGIAAYFEYSMCAADAGFAKPDARIFTALLHRTGLRPDEVLYAGDDPQVDVLGAQRAGLAAAWVNRLRQPWPPDLPPPHWSVSDLSHLADCLLDSGDR